MNNKNAIQFIKDEFAKRVAKNPNYSMRAFSNLLQINAGTLSSIMNGKRALTKKSLDQICDRLNLPPNKKGKLMQLVSKYNALKLDSDGIAFDRIRLENETFTAMTEWYHWAILQLIRVDGYGTKPQHGTTKWFSGRLQIPESQIKVALDRLIALDLIKVENGFYTRTTEQFTTKNKTVSSPALRELHKGLREKSIESVEKDPIETRAHTAMTMAINPEKISQARAIIEEFQEKITAFLEEDKKEQVYQLTVSLFPLERGEKV